MPPRLMSSKVVVKAMRTCSLGTYDFVPAVVPSLSAVANLEFFYNEIEQ